MGRDEGALRGPLVASVVVQPLQLGRARRMRSGGFQIRPLGGAPGCLMMILFSVVASVLLTVCVNLVAR